MKGTGSKFRVVLLIAMPFEGGAPTSVSSQHRDSRCTTPFLLRQERLMIGTVEVHCLADVD